MAAREGSRVGQKSSYHLHHLGNSNRTVLTLEEVLLVSEPRVIICVCFNGKNQRQMFLLRYGSHVGAHSRGTNMASPRKAP